MPKMTAQGVHALRFLHKQDPTKSSRDLGAIFRCSSATVSYWLRSEHLPGEYARNAPRCDAKHHKAIKRRRDLVKGIASEMVVKADTEYPANPSAGSIQSALARRHSISVTCSTIRSDLKAAGMVCRRRTKVPLVRHDNFKQRYEFTKRVRQLRYKGSSIVFTDEKIFETNDNACPTSYVPRECAPHAREVSRWPHRIMVWAAIGKGFKFLVVLDNNMASQKAKATASATPSKAGKKQAGKKLTKAAQKAADVKTAKRGINSEDYIRQVLAPFIALKKKLKLQHTVFQQDGASIHTSKMTQEYLAANSLTTLKWPAKSPDLNPIERMWAVLQRRVGDTHPLTMNDLRESIVACFDALEQSTIDSIVDGFDRRVQAVARQQGAWTDAPRSYAPRKRR